MIATISPDKGFPMRLAMHRFEKTKDGQLAHYTDDQLRATVPPDSWEAYREDWPAAGAVIDQLTDAHTAPAAGSASTLNLR